MTPLEFTNALSGLGWKQSDFCRKTGVSKDTPSRWAAGKTPIQAWVPAYLGAMLELKRLHAKYIEPDKGLGSPERDAQPLKGSTHRGLED